MNNCTHINNCNSCIDQMDNRMKELVHQALAEERERAHRLVKLYGTPNCDYLHHNKKQQHESGEICPVVTEITDLLSSLDTPLTDK